LEAEVIGVISERTGEALPRAGGAPLVAGNRARFLKDATGNSSGRQKSSSESITLNR
jgi:hypothetical protein